MSFKKSQVGLQFGGQRVSADEMDVVRQYVVLNPTVDPVWFGTTTLGTQTTSQALTITNKAADYPRNLVVGLQCPAGSVMGGTFVYNAKDQFGNSFAESVVIPTVAGGGTVAGTNIVSQIVSGTFNFGTGNPGNGTPRIGVAIGTAGTIAHKFGLPDRIAAVSDVKSITWRSVGTSITFNGGTVDSTVVGTANSTFNGTAIVAVTDGFFVNYRSTYAAQENVQTL